MFEKRKAEPKLEKDAGERQVEDNVAHDQMDRRYYYDDAYGYEKFDPEADPDNEDEDETAS